MVPRRAWLAGALLAWIGPPTLGQEPGPSAVDEERERAEVEALGKQAGLRPFRIGRSPRFLALGDARDDFRSLTLRDCEAVADDYLAHYRAKGFEVRPPSTRLTIVTLDDDRSFAAYLNDKSYLLVPGRDPRPSIQGVYQRSTNRFVTYDHRSLGPQLAPRAGYESLRILAHEATHQLANNTGLLERRGDVPACINEGLAMYGEVRKPGGRTPPGQVNLMRLQDLARVQRRRIAWIPLDELLVSDRHVNGALGEDYRLLAYAESWLLVHYLMTEPAALPGFRNYLEALRVRHDPESRRVDAEAHLGDLDRLNREVRTYGIRLQKSAVR